MQSSDTSLTAMLERLDSKEYTKLLNIKGDPELIKEIKSSRQFIIYNNYFCENTKENLLIAIDGFLYDLKKLQVSHEIFSLNPWVPRSSDLTFTKMQSFFVRFIDFTPGMHSSIFDPSNCMPMFISLSTRVMNEGKRLINLLSNWPIDKVYIDVLKKNICLIIECATNEKMVAENVNLQWNITETKKLLLDYESTVDSTYRLDLTGLELNFEDF